MRTTSLLLAVALATIGCSSGASPSLTPDPSVAATAESPPASANVSVLEGRWATGPIPIADIKAAMIAAGITAADVDAWVTDAGSPTQYSFVLAFAGQTFTHYQETPEMPMDVDESGTFALSGTELVLAPGDPGNIDTYTLAASLSGDDLSLRWVASTEEGTAEAKETHRRFTIALYCSAVFRRVVQ
ncbi:MAG: hypothetical protein ABI458_06400 [Chloroflexota bacterium]